MLEAGEISLRASKIFEQIRFRKGGNKYLVTISENALNPRGLTNSHLESSFLDPLFPLSIRNPLLRERDRNDLLG